MFFLEKKKKPRLSVDQPSDNCAQYNIYCASKTKRSFYTPKELWPVSPQTTSTCDKLYDIMLITSLQNLFIIMHSLNQGFAVRNPFMFK